MEISPQLGLDNCSPESLIVNSELVKDGDLMATTNAFVKSQYYRGKLRALNSPKKKVADIVRQATKYARDEVLRKNPLTVDIADYLEEYVKVGQTCEYRGDWKFRF